MFGNSKKTQNVGCFNCGKQGHLKRNHMQDVPRNNILIQIEGPSLLNYAKSLAKASTGLMNTAQGTAKVTLCHW